MFQEKAVSITVRGNVQGVGFRYFVKTIARRLGLFGFVKNLDTGAVYIESKGENAKIDILTEKCKEGPILSKVTSVEVEEIDKTNFDDFKILN